MIPLLPYSCSARVFWRGLCTTCCKVIPNTNIKAITQPYTMGEGPHWDAYQQALFFVDIFCEVFHRYVPATKVHTSCNLKGGTVSFVVPVEGPPGQYVVSHGRKLLLVTWDGIAPKPYKIEKISEIDTVGDAVNNRFNDGKCDPYGRLYAGTMGPEAVGGHIMKNKGSFFRWDCTIAEPKTLLERVSIANGLAWNVEKKIMYFIDSLEYRVDQFDYDPDTGDIWNCKTVFELKSNNIPGLPDGMCIDSEGKLWIACHGGSRVIRIDPDTGRLLKTLMLPIKYATSVTFGGPNMDILYVTSASLLEGENNPEGGKVFEVVGLGVQGFPGVNMKI